MKTLTRDIMRYCHMLSIPLAFGLTMQAGGAISAVDWLEFVPGGTSSGFALRNDTGASLAEGLLSIRRGVSFSGFPAARNFADAYWQGETGLNDSVTGDSTVHGVAFRVASIGAAADYTIEFEVPEGKEILLMVGDLYHGSDVSHTAGMMISALTDSGAGSVSLEGMWSWDNGVSRMSEDLFWNAGTSTLSTVSGEVGESQAAFFRIASLSGANPRLVLTVPDGLSGTGDAIVLAIGIVVPEPSVAMLAVAGATGALLRRRRRD